MLLWRTWRETPCTPRRRFARLTCKSARTRRCCRTKNGVHLREHRSDLHVMWSFQRTPAPALASRGCTLAVPAAHARKLHLREALDAVLGDARKEQRLQLGGTLAKDQSLTEDALALVKTAFIAG